jgi:hypothetical protein
VTTEPVCWGVHRGPDGLLWLLQPRGAANAWGVEADCPFTPRRELPCPHDLDTAVRSPPQASIKDFETLLADPLLAFLAGSGPGRGRLPDTPVARILVRLYLRLYGGLSDCVVPVEILTRTTARKLLTATNFAPLVVTGCTLRFFEQARTTWEIAEGSPRKLLLMGDRSLPLPGLIDRPAPEPVEAEAASILPWTALGAHWFRSLM